MIKSSNPYSQIDFVMQLSYITLITPTKRYSFQKNEMICNYEAPYLAS